MGQFELVGKEPVLGEVDISRDEVLQLYSLAIEVPTKKLEITDDSTRVVGIVSAIEDTIDWVANYRVRNAILATRTYVTGENVSEESVFGSILFRFSSFRDSQRDTKIHEMFEIDTFGSNVIRARRSLFVARNVGQVLVSSTGQYFDNQQRQYKRYDRNMKSEDVGYINTKTTRLLARAGI